MISAKDVTQYTKEFSVMFVEDEENLRESFSKILQKLFLSVKVASDGRFALDTYQSLEQKPDIIITDINMPRLNGIELVKHIKQIDPDQIIIILSAHSDSQYLLELINLDVDGFLTKPIDTDQFLRLLYKKAKGYHDSKMLEYYQNELELTVKKLESQKETIAFKSVQKAKMINDHIEKSFLDEQHIQEFYIKLDMADVEQFGDDLYDFDSYLISSSEKDIIDFIQLSNYFKTIATVLLRWNLFADVGNSMMDFANTLQTTEVELDEKKRELIYRIIESMLITLDNFSKNVLLKQSSNPTFFNQSLISDLEQIKNLLAPIEDDIDDIEFF